LALLLWGQDERADCPSFMRLSDNEMKNFDACLTEVLLDQFRLPRVAHACLVFELISSKWFNLLEIPKRYDVARLEWTVRCGQGACQIRRRV
jgi:hypothetical protein